MPHRLIQGYCCMVITSYIFFRCHRSFWINKLSISKIDHDTYILDDGTQVPISGRKNES
jgi:DNA-binding LytR/AlgR family response regulator